MDRIWPMVDMERVLVSVGRDATPVERYAFEEMAQFFRDAVGRSPHVAEVVRRDDAPPDHDEIAVGTSRSHPLLSQLFDDGMIRPPRQPQGYAIKTVDHPHWPGRLLLAVCGTDGEGALYGVRDLVHYHLDVSGELDYRTDRGNVFRTVYRDRCVRVPRIDTSDYPRVAHRAFWAYDVERNVNPPGGEEYVAFNPYRWVDNMSRFKANTLLVWEGRPGQFFGVRPDFVRYAHSRGVKVVVGMGFYSYGTEPEAPVQFLRSPASGDVPAGQFWASDTVLCPQQPETQDWMRRLVIDYLGRHELDGLAFQTGEVDFRNCACSRCADVPIDRYFLEAVDPILSAIYAHWPDYWVISNQLNRREYHETFKRMDERVWFLWESGVFPVCSAVGQQRDHVLSDGGAAALVRPEKFGFVYRFYMGGMCQPWLDERRTKIEQLLEWGRLCLRHQARLSCGLFQSRKPAIHPVFLQAMFSEMAWNCQMTNEEFLQRCERLKKFAPHDEVYAHLISDPPAVQEPGPGRVRHRKRLVGLDRRAVIDQFHGIRGQFIGDLNVSTMMGDVLHAESDPAVYWFDVQMPVTGARLLLVGCRDDMGHESQYVLEVTLNGNSLGTLDIDLPIGQGEGVEGFTNPGEFAIDLPASRLTERAEIELRLVSRYGWLYLREIVLESW